MSAWLYIGGVSRETWTMSPGPATLQAYGGKQADQPYVPGTLLTFPSVVQAAKAAVRLCTELEYLTPHVFVVDDEGDPKKLPIYASELKGRVVLLTKVAARLLAGEPAELLPGPQIRMEGGAVEQLQMLPVSQHNIGWSLPTLSIDKNRPAYLKKSEPAVVNIHLNSKKIDNSFSIADLPWKFILFTAIVFFILFLGYLGTKALLLKPVKKLEPLAVQTYTPEPYVLPDPTATPVVGFGEIVIQTNPKDAQILVNDIVKGSKSPLILKQQSNMDMFKLTVRKKGYKPYIKIFNIEANTQFVINVDLEKN